MFCAWCGYAFEEVLQTPCCKRQLCQQCYDDSKKYQHIADVAGFYCPMCLKFTEEG